MKETRIYKQVNNCSIYADIYYQGANSPVIVYIHGGALIFGGREMLSSEQIEFLPIQGSVWLILITGWHQKQNLNVL